MIYAEALDIIKSGLPNRSVFLAGGITGCPNWQQEMVKLLSDTDLIIFNPRRANFPIDDPSAALGQITWEHNYLRAADTISFWFAKETIQPITLYELGSWSTRLDKDILIGVHPEYPRRQDVEIQTRLVRPNVRIEYSLEDLAKQIRMVGRKEKEVLNQITAMCEESCSPKQMEEWLTLRKYLYETRTSLRLRPPE